MTYLRRRARHTTCPYCRADARFSEFGHETYPYQRDYGPVWICPPCQAWVGVHRGTHTPLGRLANKELRGWKMRAHDAFDPLWKHGEKRYFRTRNSAYRWLAQELELQSHEAHIGMFDINMCKRVIEVCLRSPRPAPEAEPVSDMDYGNNMNVYIGDPSESAPT